MAHPKKIQLKFDIVNLAKKHFLKTDKPISVEQGYEKITLQNRQRLKRYTLIRLLIMPGMKEVEWVV